MSEGRGEDEGRIKERPSWVHGLLFLATLLTTTMAGAIFVHQGRESGSWLDAVRPISDGLSYSVPLMLILGAHELGHYFAARAHGVPASLPLFVPLPPMVGLGTLGAIITMDRSTRDRRKLIDIGAAGPLAGLAIAVPVIILGLSLSKVGPLVPGGEQEGNSLLYAVLKRLCKGEWLPSSERDVFLHPTLWAGWAGLMVTMINLLPIGQFDGGHIATAYFGNRYRHFARRLQRALPLFAAAVFVWTYFVVRKEMPNWSWNNQIFFRISLEAALPWLVWFVMTRIVLRLSGGNDHPLVDETPLPGSRRFLFWVMVVVFVSTFMPVPLRPTLASPASTVADAARVATPEEGRLSSSPPAAERRP